MIFQNIPEPIDELIRVLGYWDYIFSGFLITLWLYGCALILGFFLGLFLSIVRTYGNRFFSTIATAYIDIMRGTPLIAQLLLIYFLPYSLNIPISAWSFKANFVMFDKNITLILLDHKTMISILALSLNSGAYQAEYLRGSLMSVGSGQLLAAQSVGMSRLAGIRHIVLPQALRRVIPAWSNEAAYLPKYTVVVYFIGVSDLFSEGYYIVSRTFLTLATFIVIAIVFLILISIISKGLDILHEKTRIPGL